MSSSTCIPLNCPASATLSPLGPNLPLPSSPCLSALDVEDHCPSLLPVSLRGPEGCTLCSASAFSSPSLQSCLSSIKHQPRARRRQTIYHTLALIWRLPLLREKWLSGNDLAVTKASSARWFLNPYCSALVSVTQGALYRCIQFVCVQTSCGGNPRRHLSSMIYGRLSYFPGTVIKYHNPKQLK